MSDHRHAWIWWQRAKEAVRDNSWLLPTLGAVVGLGLSLWIGTDSDADPASWAITVERSRNTFLSLLGLVFTALSIVLALASVAAQNVAGRYGARVLRIYLRGYAGGIVIGVFTLSATFVVSQQFQERGMDADDLAPRSGLVFSVVLLALSGATMLWYLGQIVAWFRADVTIFQVGKTIQRASRSDQKSRRVAGAPTADLPTRPTTFTPIPARRSGFVGTVDPDVLRSLAEKTGRHIVIESRLDSAVVKGAPLGWIDGDVHEQAAESAAGAVDITNTRELEKGVIYGLVGLVDVAIIALSPAVNDPNTAVEVIESLMFLFPRLADTSLGPYGITDHDGQTVATVASQTFGGYLERTTKQIVLYGKTDPCVVEAFGRLADTLGQLDLDAADRKAVDAFTTSVRAAERDLDPPE